MGTEKRRSLRQGLWNAKVEKGRGTGVGADGVSGSNQIRKDIRLKAERALPGKIVEQRRPEQINAGVDDAGCAGLLLAKSAQPAAGIDIQGSEARTIFDAHRDDGSIGRVAREILQDRTQGGEDETVPIAHGQVVARLGLGGGMAETAAVPKASGSATVQRSSPGMRSLPL